MTVRALLLASAAVALAGAFPAFAAPDPTIRNSVAVCNPNNPQQCEQPNSDGSITMRSAGGSVSSGSDGAATSTTNQGVVSYNDIFNGTTWDRWYGSIAGGARVQSGLAVASTDASGAVATAGTYQTLQAANSARKGCVVQNTSANAETLRVNTTVFGLAAGQTYTCAQGLMVNGDAMAITSGTVGSSFSAMFE